jgi:hypothetical protein
MTDEPGDEDIRRRFQELKVHDRLRAPAFGAVMESARAHLARPRGRAALRAAAAALLLVAGAAAAVLLFHNRSAKPELVALGNWRSPTGSLLEAPGAAFLNSVPSVTASLIQPGDPANLTSRRSGHSKGDTL